MGLTEVNLKIKNPRQPAYEEIRVEDLIALFVAANFLTPQFKID